MVSPWAGAGAVFFWVSTAGLTGPFAVVCSGSSMTAVEVFVSTKKSQACRRAIQVGKRSGSGLRHRDAGSEEGLASLLFGIPRQRNELNRNDRGLFHDAAMFLQDIQFLRVSLADRDNHPAAFLQLFDERLRHVVRRGGDYDCVEGRMFRPAFVTVAAF